MTAVEPRATPLPVTARFMLSLTVAAGLVGIVLVLYWGYRNESMIFEGAGFSTTIGPGWAGLANQLFFFTVLSNILVGVNSVALLLNPTTQSTVLHAVRISALVNIAITGLVFNLLISDDVPPGMLSEIRASCSTRQPPCWPGRPSCCGDRSSK